MSAGEALAAWLTRHERYDVDALEAERIPAPVELMRRRDVLLSMPADERPARRAS